MLFSSARDITPTTATTTTKCTILIRHLWGISMAIVPALDWSDIVGLGQNAKGNNYQKFIFKNLKFQ